MNEKQQPEKTQPRPVRVREPLRLRFTLLLVVLGLVFFGAVGLLQYMEGLEKQESMVREGESRAELLRRVVELKGRSLAQFAEDYSQWDEMVHFVQTGDKEWAAVNIDPSLKVFQTNAAWVFNREGRLVYSATQGLPENAVLPSFTGEQLQAQYAREQRENFFVMAGTTLFECRVANVFTSADMQRRGESFGWYVVARAWGSEQFDSVSMLTQGRVVLQTAPPEQASTLSGAGFHVIQPLGNGRGGVVAWLQLTGSSQLLRIGREHDSLQFWLFVGFGVVTLSIVAFGVNVWVIQPLRAISASLEGDQPGQLRDLLEDRSEMGRIALLVEDSFLRKQSLRREVEARRLTEEALRESEVALRELVEDRARLARDLHDGVIQNLYAAGMGVGAVGPLLRKDPEEAQQRLEQSRLLLNEVIRDVRAFIEGMEPEGFAGGFAEVLKRMAIHMRAIKSFELALDMEAGAEEELDSGERAHLLHIAREAISNALRHGGASRIEIALRREQGGLAFRVFDDGSGVPAGGGSGGRGLGLANIERRAEDMNAGVSISRGASGGTVLRLWIPGRTPETST